LLASAAGKLQDHVAAGNSKKPQVVLRRFAGDFRIERFDGCLIDLQVALGFHRLPHGLVDRQQPLGDLLESRNKIISEANANPKLTTGLICAPPIFPTGEIAIMAPVVPNRKPVIKRPHAPLGVMAASGLPAPDITMTTESPTNTKNAIPINSERKAATA
jgi:hypothetical protein